MSWLENDLNSTTRPTIVFLHEPTIDLINREVLLEVLKAHDVKMIFSGHWHVNDLLNSSGIPEQITTAVSGAWWVGTDVVGTPGGYLIVAINGSRIDTFYRYTGVPKQINLIEPAEPLASGELKITAQIWTGKLPVKAWVSIDKGPSKEMNVTWQGLWYEARSSMDIQNLTKGYHKADIISVDSENGFSTSFSFKVTDEVFIPIGEILLHPETYLGKHPMIKGYPDSTVDLTFLELGVQPVFRDDTGKMPFVLGNCKALPRGENKTQWMARGQFQRYDKTANTSEFLTYRDDSCPERIAA